jgi:hypothetical protein
MIAAPVMFALANTNVELTRRNVELGGGSLLKMVFIGAKIIVVERD